MNARKEKLLKKLKEQTSNYIFSIPSSKNKNFMLLFKYPLLGWMFKQVLHIMSLQKFFLHDLLEYFNCKINQSKYIIIGENPFISLCLLKNLADKSYLEKKRISVSILKFSNTDYWGYHAFEKEDTWNYISELFNKKISNITQFMEECISISNNQYVDLSFLDINNQIDYVKYDEMSGKWVLFLNKISLDKDTDSCMKELPTVLMLEKNLKEKYWKNIIDKLNIDISIIKEDQEKMVVFAETIFLSSYPKNWLNVEAVKANESSYFKHILSENSFGTSKRMTNEFSSLDDHVVEDLNSALNTKIY